MTHRVRISTNGVGPAIKDLVQRLLNTEGMIKHSPVNLSPPPAIYVRSQSLLQPGDRFLKTAQQESFAPSYVLDPLGVWIVQHTQGSDNRVAVQFVALVDQRVYPLTHKLVQQFGSEGGFP